MKTACIIPARGGSKGIPRKNLMEIVEGISLLEWTIRQALAAYSDNEVIVSSDDSEMLALGRRCGADTDKRPAGLAEDESSTAAVVVDFLQRIDVEGVQYDKICILQATSPLRVIGDVENAKRLFGTGSYDSVVSAFGYTAHHPAKMYIEKDGSAVSVMPEFENARRQDLPEIYKRNGAIFLVDRKYFERTGKLWGGRTGLVNMPPERSVDIDALEDLNSARRYVAANRAVWP